jgi:hypothetical protein
MHANEEPCWSGGLGTWGEMTRKLEGTGTGTGSCGLRFGGTGGDNGTGSARGGRRSGSGSRGRGVGGGGRDGGARSGSSSGDRCRDDSGGMSILGS